MSDNLSDALRALEKSRDILLENSQQAGKHGDWIKVRSLMNLAEQVDSLREQLKTLVSSSLKTGPAPKTSAKPTTHPETSPAPSSFPRFWVRGSVLVKQGLQRNGRDVYEHTVSQENYGEIIELLTTMAVEQQKGKQREFSIDNVAERMEIPKYMVYTVVSLLLHKELLHRARKGAYLFPAEVDFPAQVGDLWAQLPRLQPN